MFQEIIVKPLYNIFVGIMDILPWADVGLVIIIFTVFVRLILFPFYKHSLLAQVKMKEVEPEVNRIKAKYGANRQEQAAKVMEFYKANDIKPFRSVLLTLIQLPILIAFVSVFYRIVPAIHPDLLYGFVHLPATVKASLFGLNLTSHNIVLAILTGIAQFFQLRFSILTRQQKAMSQAGGSADSTTQMMNSMNSNMQLFLPIFAVISIYFIIPSQYSSIVAIYWLVSTLFTLGQELYIRKRHIEKPKAVASVTKQ